MHLQWDFHFAAVLAIGAPASQELADFVPGGSVHRTPSVVHEAELTVATRL